MKLIFLDIDGVMNHRDYFVRSRLHQLQEFCPISVRNLREIIKRTDANIVISSSWRLGGAKEMKQILSCYDLDKYFVGLTPVINDGIRGLEIQAFIDAFPSLVEPIESFVILDDDKDMGDLLPHLVYCRYGGLNDDRREEAISILNKEVA
jgi:hypothetical protein